VGPSRPLALSLNENNPGSDAGVFSRLSMICLYGIRLQPQHNQNLIGSAAVQRANVNLA